jgi:hypothetical protein
MTENISNVEIYKWLEFQKYQTEIEQEQGNTMYYSADMPTILKDFLQWAKENNK